MLSSIEACTADERGASDGNPGFQMAVQIDRALAVQFSLRGKTVWTCQGGCGVQPHYQIVGYAFSLPGRSDFDFAAPAHPGTEPGRTTVPAATIVSAHKRGPNPLRESSVHEPFARPAARGGNTPRRKPDRVGRVPG